MTFLSLLGSIVCEDSLGSVARPYTLHTRVLTHTCTLLCGVYDKAL